jgi:Cu+-exporting ATPase
VRFKRRVGAFAAAYQIEMFWVGLALNAAGLVCIGHRVIAATREHPKREHRA